MGLVHSIGSMGLVDVAPVEEGAMHWIGSMGLLVEGIPSLSSSAPS